MKKLLLATKNPGKVKEISKFLKDLNLEIVSLKDLHVKEDIEENEKTYKANSQKKAIFFSKLTNLPAIGDDGGLEIEALNGEPGIHSRRWLGYAASDEVLIEHLNKVIKQIPKGKRQARFIDVVSFALPSGKVWSQEGKVKGELVDDPHLKFLKGYPYRSFFYIPEIKKFYHESELTTEEERIYNHRYKALVKIKEIIKKELKI
ncbi:MAG TPA: non-canonical purine NTP pyrophosphatase [Patescibacteria group bacterium]|nr:non-canonical purine NTP pyrophosphatase [Patescibacteria group bacterium]